MAKMEIRVIDAYVYINIKNSILFLLLKRSKTKMYEHIWQGVAGKIEKDEKSWQTAKRELHLRKCLLQTMLVSFMKQRMIELI